jgi:hypothetical protein
MRDPLNVLGSFYDFLVLLVLLVFFLNYTIGNFPDHGVDALSF